MTVRNFLLEGIFQLISTLPENYLAIFRQHKLLSLPTFGHLPWELVDPVVADPIAQDNDKRNNIQIYTEIPYESTQREGTKLPNIHILLLSCRTGSPTTVGHFLRGRSLKARCNIRVYVPVGVPVCVCVRESIFGHFFPISCSRADLCADVHDFWCGRP